VQQASLCRLEQSKSVEDRLTTRDLTLQEYHYKEDQATPSQRLLSPTIIMGDACELAKILDKSLELLKTIGDLQEPDLTAILAASKAEIEGYVEILRADGETPASSQTPSTSQTTPATVPASRQEPQLMKPLGELSNHTIVCLPRHVHQPVAQPANGGQSSRQMRGSRNRQPLSSTQVPDSQPVDLPLAVNPC
jgi:hypothetical protein